MEFPSANVINEPEIGDFHVNQGINNASDLNDSTAVLFTDTEFDSISQELEDLEVMNETDCDKTQSNDIGILDESKDFVKIDGVIENIISGIFSLNDEIEKNMELTTPTFPGGVEREDPDENESNQRKMLLNSDLNVSFRNRNERVNQHFQNIANYSDGTLTVRNQGEKIENLENNNLLKTKLVKELTVLSSQQKRKLDCIMESNNELIENKKEFPIETVSKDQYLEKQLVTSLHSHPQKMCEEDYTSDINLKTKVNGGIVVKEENLQENKDNVTLESSMCSKESIPGSLEKACEYENSPAIDSSSIESNKEEVAIENMSTDHSEEKEKSEEEKDKETKDVKKEAISYFQHYSNPFEIVVPLIGTGMFLEFGDLKPFTHRYDLAKERNRLRAQNQDSDIPTMSYEEYRKQQDSRSQEEVETEKRTKKYEAMEVAAYLTRIAIKILRELQKDDPSEEYIEKYFRKFQYITVSSLALVYAPHFMHTVMFCRGCTDFSNRLRSIADDCYTDCHAMFPIPQGYNFETVYASELKKNLPEEYEGISDIIPEYGDYECPSSDSEDSAFYDDNSN